MANADAVVEEIIRQELHKIEDGVEAQIAAAAKRIANQRIQKELARMSAELDSVADTLQGVVTKINRANTKLGEII